MKEFLLEFEYNLNLYNEGNLTSEDFFKWICNKIIEYGGKLPVSNTIDPPDPDIHL